MTPDERDEPIGTLNGNGWIPPAVPGLSGGRSARGALEPRGLRPRHDRAATAGSPSETLPSIPVALVDGSYTRFGKRLCDFVSAGIGLILLLPVYLLLALAVRLDTPGPIFYCSWRVGEGGRLFRFLKFRSMVVGADSIREDLRHLNEVDGPVFKMARDPRITRVGNILRRTSLDELPQMWNVLRGDMSLVGPRPPLPEEVRMYEPWQLRRLSVRPGLTCLWQISGRSHIGFDEWMRLDMEYIDHRSFILDLKILLLTIPAVLSGKGAY